MISLSDILKHYKRREIQEEIVRNAQDREVAFRINDQFGSRPDVLNYPADVLELAKKGVTSFHASEERWRNPLALSTSLNKRELDELRVGWDLVLDIDCAILDYSKIAADLIVKALRYHGISGVSVKFSGNLGFHIGVPFEAFPETMNKKQTRTLFPEGARRVAYYIKEMIKEPLKKEIMRVEENDITNIIKRTGKQDIIRIVAGIPSLDIDSFLSVDTMLITSRHLYRMPYCFNEKSGRISIPINPDKVLAFDKESARPENVKVSKYRFLDKEKVIKNEANKLLMQAFDFIIKEEKVIEERDYELPEQAIPEACFPPCIKNCLKGLEDGRKRAVFILINFLTKAGWDYKAIETLLREWNEKNKEPLRWNYIDGQLRYQKLQKKKMPPPNCSNEMYYKDIRICSPDNLCNKIRNPINYVLIKSKKK